MTFHVRQRDPKSVQAAAETLPTAARQILMAMATATNELQAVMRHDARYLMEGETPTSPSPVDPRSAFEALLQLRRGQAAIDAAVAEYLAWCSVGGVTRTGMATGLGVRPATLAKMLAPVESIASARSADLQKTDAGWVARRAKKTVPATSREA